MQENLNKENLFNRLYELYPKGMKVFCDWIDEYKKKNNWNMLFNSYSEYQNADGKNAPAPKFHDLPLAMQIGIWQQFVKESLSYIDKWKIEDLIHHDWFEEIEEYIHVLNDIQINRERTN